MGTLTGARVVTRDAVLDPGWVDFEGDRILGVGVGTPPRQGVDLEGRWVVPGFIDLHVHGGGGHDFMTGDVGGVPAAIDFHQRHGTTTTLISLATAPRDELLAAVDRTVEALAVIPELRLRVAGIHLEGPYLSVARCGAQDPAAMIDPDPGLTDALLERGAGLVRVMTLAPERRGADALIARLRAAGVVAAVGHTDATYDQTIAAVRAGVGLATHLGNGMRPFHHREPGAFGACLREPGVVCELIADGTHLHPTVVELVCRTKGADGTALITDAIAAAGTGDGHYHLGSRPVEVRGGVARLADGGSLAGSTLTMDVAFANAVSYGVPITGASRAASSTPAAVLGLGDLTGTIDTGMRADLVVLDDDLAPVAVIAQGRRVHGTLDD